MSPDTSAARTTTRPSLSVRNTGGGVDIGDPRLRAIANRAEQTLQLAALRALASLASPAVYPPAAAGNSIEPLIRSMFGKRNAAKQQSAISKAMSILGGPQQGLTDRFGALAAIDLHSTVPVEVQANAVPVPEALRLSETDFLNLTMANNHLVISSGHPLLSPVPPISPSGDSLRSPLITVLDPVQDKYLKLGGEQGFLGKPVAPETTAPDGVGRFRHYQGGSIYWSPTTGAHEVHGPIRNKWASLLWERSTLGYPTTDEIGTPDKVGRYNHFQGGSIYWTPTLGAHAVGQHVRQKWAELGWEQGPLGYPLDDSVGLATSLPSQFQGGTVTWLKTTGAVAVFPASKLQFRLLGVHCDWTTSGFGSDEIAMGGVATDPDAQSSQIAAFRVGGDGFEFDDGTVFNYSPPLVFCEFNLQGVKGWPRTYMVTEMLAELDSGGFTDDLKQLLAYIKAFLKDRLAKAGVSGVTALFGSLLGELVGPLGAAVGALIGFLVGAFFDWLITLFDDDPFPVIPIVFTLPDAHVRWNAGTTSPALGYFCEANGGHYDLSFDWHLVMK